jgi:IS5 family transposase
MKQQTFSDMEYSNRKKKTKREEFLEIMNEVILWDEWVALVEPYYPKGKRGRPPIQLETILRMYLLQVWFNLSDEGVEDAIYDSYAMRKFMGINFLEEQVPDATTLLHFRHLVEKNEISKLYFDAIKNGLEKCGRIMHGGTIVDATIIEAPSSTKNASGERDPEMHQTKKGNQWHFGMKMHAGVDAGTGYIHTITATAANVHDVDQAANLIREDDTVVYGDAGYLGIEKREAVKNDSHKSTIVYRTNLRPGKVNALADGPGKDWFHFIEHQKSSVRCKVEHIFQLLKNRFGYRKVRYRGIEKNFSRLFMICSSINLWFVAASGGWHRSANGIPG